jgi:tRNA 2-selenouridine synthase
MSLTHIHDINSIKWLAVNLMLFDSLRYNIFAFGHSYKLPIHIHRKHGKMIHSITVSDLMGLKDPIPLADVRTPTEFEHGHIPGAFNLPLFSDGERVSIGTTYKQVGKEAAIILGFDLTGPKWSGFIRQAVELAPGKKIAVHCWRGGMRSGAMAWALDIYGFEVYKVEGGYKQYRRWVLDQFEATYALYILGGMTGSGKTRILHELRSLGQQVIDLEELAQHQGSSFGSMNKLVQPTQEQFENNLASELNKADKQRKIWVEDESSSIGKRTIPRPLWDQMVASFLIDIKVSAAQRMEALVQEYGSLDKDFLIECTERIRKRLGLDQAKNAIIAIKENRIADFIRVVMVYYDKTYRTSLARRNTDHILKVDLKSTDHTQNAGEILHAVHAIPAGKLNA